VEGRASHLEAERPSGERVSRRLGDWLYRRIRISSDEDKGENQEVFWPVDILPLPAQCPNARVLTWGYDSNVSNFFRGPTGQNTIFSHSKDLLYALNRERSDCLKRSLIFVAHSLGGIIVKDVLHRASLERDPALQDIYASTRAVIFLGTPHRGSDWVDFGNTIRKIASVAGFDTSSQILNALKIDSPEISMCQENFMRLYEDHKFEVRTFQEAKGMTGTSFFKFNEKVSSTPISGGIQGGKF
jgi:ankyrin repeat domain-containing protein 50